MLEQVRKHRTDILVELFNEERIVEDSSSEPEQMPMSAVSSTGMGSFATSSTAGKYEGFGNSPINKSSVTDRLRDMMESVMNLPDPKQEILKLCLEDPVGDYQPLVLPCQPVSRPRTVSSPAKPHTPGRPGGGWSSSSEDEESALEEFNTSLSLQTEQTDRSSEQRAVLEFCQSDHQAELRLNVEKCLAEITGEQASLQTGLFCIINILGEEEEEGGDERRLRGLLLLEHLIHRALLPPVKIKNLFSKVEGKLQESKSKQVVVKSKKISLILSSLTNS